MRQKISMKTLGIKKTPMITTTERVRGASTTRGRRFKKGITRFLASLFRINETLPMSKKMTDGEIARQVRVEYRGIDDELVKKFSTSNPDLKKMIYKYRSEYNSGRLVVADGKPKRSDISFCYNEDGLAVNPRYLNLPVMTEEQKEEYRDKYVPRKQEQIVRKK